MRCVFDLDPHCDISDNMDVLYFSIFHFHSYKSTKENSNTYLLT